MDSEESVLPFFAVTNDNTESSGKQALLMVQLSLFQALPPSIPFCSLTSLRSPLRTLAAALLLVLSAVAALAQNAPPLQGVAPTQPGASAVSSSADDAWLAKTGKLYYSTTRAGLGGFDCAVHPDWRALFTTSSPGTQVSEDDAHVVLLKSVKITLHAHLQAGAAAGGSTMDWNPEPHPGEPLDAASSEMLTRMHDATEQTLEGFLQFWTPFVDGSTVPDSAEGLTITHTDTGHTIHAEQGDMAMTETFSSDLLLEHFDVDMKNVSIKFQPAYKPTDQGLLVKSFQAHVQPAGAADQAEDMHVDIEYQTLDGFFIPARLNVAIANSGTMNFVFDGCTVSRVQQVPPAATVKPALQ
jgi:hypothetical protein